MTNNVDREIVRGWLTGRSIARALPEPVADFGGYRVDTNSDSEAARWVFAGAVREITDLCRAINGPRHLVKAFAPASELEARLPPRWTIESEHVFMVLDEPPPAAFALPAGYRFVRSEKSAASTVEILTQDDELAASGHAGETSDAFVYDRIVTEFPHRRRGLGRALMAALGSCRQSSGARQMLVATADGERLYSALGWRTLSAYSTARLTVR